MKQIYLIIPFLAIIGLAACGHDQDIPDMKPVPVSSSAVNIPKPVKADEPRYVYHGDRHPDPFIPQNVESAVVTSGEIVIPNITSLSLKGIFSIGKQHTAIIAGPGSTYILKDSRLYDNRQRLIKGISGAIKNDSVIIISQDKTMRELKLHEKE